MAENIMDDLSLFPFPCYKLEMVMFGKNSLSY